VPGKWQRYTNRYANDIITKAASILVQSLLLIEISELLAWQETSTCCGAVDDDEVDFTHDCTNKVELIAVKMAMIIWSNCFQKSFFIYV
jgi:hypothetical protein